MGRYVLRRLGLTAITLVLVSFAVFAAAQVLPGDVGRTILGPYASQQQVDQVETGDEQDDRRHDHQKQGETGDDRAASRTRQEHETRRGRHLDRVAGVGRRKRLLESSRNGRESWRARLDRGPRAEPAHDGQLVSLARAERERGRDVARSERTVRA